MFPATQQISQGGWASQLTCTPPTLMAPHANALFLYFIGKEVSTRLLLFLVPLSICHIMSLLPRKAGTSQELSTGGQHK